MVKKEIENKISKETIVKNKDGENLKIINNITYDECSVDDSTALNSQEAINHYNKYSKYVA